jgi:uncharacterized protein
VAVSAQKIAVGATLALVILGVSGWGLLRGEGGESLSPLGTLPEQIEPKYQELSFERLSKREIIGSEIVLGESLSGGEGYASRKFFYESGGKRISGQINLPVDLDSQQKPVIVMARGYAPKEGYYIGLGTRNAAAVYARNGYITLAPDFLGYGESEMEDIDSIGARLYRPVEILSLLSSLSSLPQADLSRVYLWGHSNGGQIMLSVAEVIGMGGLQGDSSQALQVRGVTLWAPVSKPFPYSVLFYTDEADDRGKLMRQKVSEFEQEYDVFEFSIDQYLGQIEIPVQIHQGTSDTAVPYWWSDELNDELEDLDKDVRYFKYPGADHNMRPVWDTVVSRDLQFMRELR